MQLRRMMIQELRYVRAEHCPLGHASEIEQNQEQPEENEESCRENRLDRQWIVRDVAVDEPFHMSGCRRGRQRQAGNQTSRKQSRFHHLQSEMLEVIRRPTGSTHHRIEARFLPDRERSHHSQRDFTEVSMSAPVMQE